MSAAPDILMERGMPASPDAERSILGAVLLENAHYQEAAAAGLDPDDFSLDSHRKIYSRMQAMCSENVPVDLVTLVEELAKRKEVEAIGGVAYIASLTEGLPRRVSIEEYVHIVREKAMLRATIRTANYIGTRAVDQSEDVEAILADADQLIRDIANRAITEGFQTPTEVIASRYESLDAFAFAKQRKGSVFSGWTRVDRMLHGFKPKDLIIIAARPSMGKTAWAVNVATHAAIQQGKTVGIFSLEMSSESLIHRMASGIGRYDSRRRENDWLSADEKQRMLEALSAILDSSLYIDDTGALTMLKLRARAHRLKQQKGSLDLIMVDYLQLLDSGVKKENRTQEVSYISRGLKALAKELDVPVIALSQLSRKNEERADKRPLLSDLRESGSIEQDADVVAFLHRPEYYDKYDDTLKGLAEFIIAKQREGPVGTVPMHYTDEHTRFDEMVEG